MSAITVFSRCGREILKYKQWLMGVAMILVILCHSQVTRLPFLKVFAPGMIGVDIFLFLSGYSLCFSYEKNALPVFYKRRFSRIVPLYVIMAVAVSVIITLQGTRLSWFGWICNVTSLSYYCVGGVQFDWYLSVLVLFYLLFPVLFKLVRSIWIWLLFLLLCAGLVFCLDLNELHECAIARIPVFCLGVLCYHKREDTLFYFYAWLISSVCLLIGVFLKMPGTFLMDMAAPSLLLVLFIIAEILFKRKENNKAVSLFYDGVEKFGVYSLPIYVSNIITFNICHFAGSPWVRLVLYCLLTAVFAWLLALADKMIQNGIRNDRI